MIRKKDIEIRYARSSFDFDLRLKYKGSNSFASGITDSLLFIFLIDRSEKTKERKKIKKYQY